MVIGNCPVKSMSIRVPPPPPPSPVHPGGGWRMGGGGGERLCEWGQIIYGKPVKSTGGTERFYSINSCADVSGALCNHIERNGLNIVFIN